jgi:hypothetical protein
MKCHAQANHYMRTANAAGSLLLRVQTVRRKRESLPGNCDQDAWVEHCAAGLMNAAAKGDPAPEPPPPTAEPEPAAAYPPTACYGPPNAKLVREIIAGTSPVFQQLDEEYAPAPPT